MTRQMWRVAVRSFATECAFGDRLATDRDISSPHGASPTVRDSAASRWECGNFRGARRSGPLQPCGRSPHTESETSERITIILSIGLSVLVRRKAMQPPSRPAGPSAISWRSSWSRCALIVLAALLRPGAGLDADAGAHHSGTCTFLAYTEEREIHRVLADPGPGLATPARPAWPHGLPNHTEGTAAMAHIETAPQDD